MASSATAMKKLAGEKPKNGFKYLINLKRLSCMSGAVIWSALQGKNFITSPATTYTMAVVRLEARANGWGCNFMTQSFFKMGSIMSPYYKRPHAAYKSLLIVQQAAGLLQR